MFILGSAPHRQSRSMFKALFVFLALATATLAPVAAAPRAVAQEEQCLSERQIQDAIDAGEISAPRDVLLANGIEERPLSFKVCGSDRDRHYVFNLRNSSGEYDSVPLGARVPNQ